MNEKAKMYKENLKRGRIKSLYLSDKEFEELRRYLFEKGINFQELILPYLAEIGAVSEEEE